MSESQLSKVSSNRYTLFFMMVLSFVCALILSLLASILAKPQEVAKELDRSKQMMIAGKVLDHEGYFLLLDKEGKYIPAKYVKDGFLAPATKKEIADQAQVLEVYKKRFIPLLVDPQGKLVTFEEAKIDRDDYINNFRKTGYYREPYKLIYEILPNPPEKGVAKENKAKPEGFVIPVNGFGLWDAIYGYLAIKPDGDTVIGISWYDQKETPGLGANISETYWQNLFPGKKIFQEGPTGKTDFKTAPLGLVVVKGKVNEVLGNSPKAKSAVDGMTGATLTGNGVNEAYRDVLAPYRSFLISLHETYEKESKSKS